MPRATTEQRRPSPVLSPPAGGAAPHRVYRAKRILKVGKDRVMPGQVVPGAQNWPRLEAWVRAGAIEEAVGERPDAG